MKHNLTIFTYVSFVLAAVFTPTARAQNYESYQLYMGGFPQQETNWSNDVQGVTHDDNNWFITNTHDIWKVPVERDLRSISPGVSGVIRKSISDYPQLAGYDHFGDPDVYRYQGVDYLIVPIENGDATCASGLPGAIALLRTDNQLSYIDHIVLPGQCNDAGWIAVNRTTGNLFSSRQHVGPLPGGMEPGLREYVFDWNWLHTTGQATIAFLRFIPLNYDFSCMQGGEFAPGDKLLYLISGFYTDSNALADREGIHILDTTSWARVGHSTRGTGGHFDYYYNPGFFTGAEEPEGLTIWNLDDGRAPGIRGQLHALVSDNDLDAGDVDFKHYTQIIRADRNSANSCQSGTPACPFHTIGSALNLAWDGAEIRIRGGVYLETATITKRVRLTAENGSVRIGG